MFTRITDDTLAGILVVMVPSERQKLLDELKQSHPDSAERVVQYIRCRFTTCGLLSLLGGPLSRLGLLQAASARLVSTATLLAGM